MSAYVPFKVGDRIEFQRQGAWQPAKVTAVHFNPNRKPGIGRVSYEVQTGPMFHPLRAAAKNVRGAS